MAASYKDGVRSKRSTLFKSSLVTEVTSQGVLLGVTVWSKTKDHGVFVELDDMNAVGHVLKKLSLGERRKRRS